jgi:hypothetical protein
MSAPCGSVMSRSRPEEPSGPPPVSRRDKCGRVLALKLQIAGCRCASPAIGCDQCDIACGLS